MMLEDINMTAAVLGALALLMALVCGKPLRRLCSWVGSRLAEVAPQWLRILGRGFTEPLILTVRVVLLAAAALLLPLPWERKTVLAAVVAMSREAGILLLSWGLWRAAPMCQLLVRSVEENTDFASGRTIGRFFENIYRVVVGGFAVLSTLDVMGVPVASLIAGAGVVGLAISLAAQSTLSNLIAGVTLVLEQPFGIGDYVTLGEVEGTVEDISFRSTRLRTPDNVLITVENATVCAEYIHNCTNRTSRLWSFEVNLAYDAGGAQQVSAAIAAMEAVLCADEQVQADTVQAVLERFDPAGVVINVRCYVNTLPFGEYRALKNRLNLRMMDAVQA
ncbi:MAG: mechanosensitive ion channel family protein, partial [Aristaeellaceae bacterium]